MGRVVGTGARQTVPHQRQNGTFWVDTKRDLLWAGKVAFLKIERWRHGLVKSLKNRQASVLVRGHRTLGVRYYFKIRWSEKRDLEWHTSSRGMVHDKLK
jgi:hypothetical protein